MALRAAVDAGAGGSIVTSVTGTANQITASPTTGAVVLSLPVNVQITTSLAIGGATIGTDALGVTGTATISGAVVAPVLTLNGTGAASNSPFLMSGAIYASGTGTTNFPALFIQPTGTTAATSWSTSGTGLGMNLATGFGGNLIDLKIAGGSTSLFRVSSVGGVSANNNITSASSIVAGTSSGLAITSKGSLQAATDGVWQILNNAGTDFGRLQFGGTTSSFPALKRSSTALQARLGDDSAFTFMQGKLQTDTNYTAGVQVITGYMVIYDAAGTAYKVSCNV